MDALTLMVTRVREEISRLKLPIIHDISIPIRSIDERTAVIASIGDLWKDISERLKSVEAISFDLAMIRLSISTQNNRQIDLVHKLRDSNQLLLRLSFRFDHRCSHLNFWDELSKARSLWGTFAQEHAKCRQALPLLAHVVFVNCVRDNPLLSSYEGHSEEPHTVLAHSVDVLRFVVGRIEP